MNRQFFFAALSVAALLVSALAGLIALELTGGGSQPGSVKSDLGQSIDTPPSWSESGPGVVVHETGAAGRDIYIVLHQAPSLAQYRGEVPGLAATSPLVTGAPRLDPSSAASVAYLEYLRAQHDQLVAGIEEGLSRSVEVTNRYDAVLNGIAVRMDKDEAVAVSHLAGIRHVERNTVFHLQTDNGPRWIGAAAIWGEDPVAGNAACAGDCGEGIIVGVIDTGINYDHPSFADIGGDGYNHVNPRAPAFFGLCAPITGLPFCNDKLIGLYDFTGVGAPEDDNGHGSHTASTAAGNVIQDATLRAPTQTISRTISGVAPHANIIAYKACNAVTGNCLANGILGSINQATLDDVDVINFSIGGSSGNPWTDLNSQAFFDAYAAGIFVAASAGNEGPGFGTLGSPADAPWVTAVGASTHDRAFTKGLINMAGGNSPPANMNGVGITAGYGPAAIVYAGDFAAQSTDPANAHLCGAGAGDPATGEGTMAPWTSDVFNGAIVVCDRGTYGRVHKGENVLAAGGGGYVLANDAANGDSLVSDPHVLPAIHITFNNGGTLKNWLDTGSGHTATITATELPENPALGDVMAAFSSRGENPSVPDVIKPDVTAPGVSIFAAWMSPGGVSLPGDEPEYNVISGTSMSSPHTAGAGALVRGVNPTWTPDQVKSALMTTAFTKLPGTGPEVHEVRKENNATAADPFDMGGGRVDLRRAAKAGIVLEVGVTAYENANPGAGGDPRTLNIASFGDNNCIGVCSWTRTLRGTANGGTWTASMTAPAGMTLTVSPPSFTLNSGGTQVITVTSNVAGYTPKGDWVFAEVRLTPSNTAVPVAHFPVAVIPVAGTSLILHLHGNIHDGCTGDAEFDLVFGGTSGDCTPFLSEDPLLDTNPAASWGPINVVLDCTNDRCISDPNWIWELTEPTTLQGPMVIEWWTAGPGHSLVLFNDYFIRLFADGTQVLETRVRHTGQLPNVPTFYSSTVDVPEVAATTNFVLHIDPIFVNQGGSFIYYDSQMACPGGTSGACDSRVSMPVVREPTNDPPVANNDNAFVEHGGTVVIDVLANDNDPDGDPLTVEVVTPPTHGSASVTVGKAIQYTHDATATTSDSLVYRITDTVGQNDTATVFITISAQCTAPTGSSSYDFESGPQGWTVDTAVTNSGVWTLVVDPSATSPVTSWFDDAASQLPSGGVAKDDRLVSPSQFVSGLTHMTFWHRYGFELAFDGGVLEVSLNGGTSWRDVEVAGGRFDTGGYDAQIDPANADNPLQGRHAWTGASDPPMGTTMTLVDVDLGALGGQEVIFRFRLGQDELSPSTSPPFGWYIDDVKFTKLLVPIPGCVPGNDPPVANPDFATVAKGGVVNVDVKANDFDPDDPNSALTVTIESQPSHGTAVLGTGGTITYDHNGDNAASDSFQYRLTDPDGAFDIGTVSITITNQPPIANDDSATVKRGGSVTIDVKANDRDPDDSTASLTVTIETPPSHGTAGVGIDGRITYTHDGSATTSDSFTYRLTDPRGASDVARVSITVSQSPPNAVDDAATTRPKTPVTVFVKANDFDPDGDPIDVTSVTQPSKGTATLNPDDSVTYRPNNGFSSGTDTFTYTLIDDRGGSDTATVRITVSSQKMSDLQVTELQAVNNRPDDGDDDFDNDGRKDDADSDDDNDGVGDNDDPDDDNDNRNDGRSRQSDKVTITATIRNTGTASAGATKTEFLIDGFRIALVDTGSISAGGQRKVSIVWDTSQTRAGPHEITAVADRNGQVTESNETNNTRTISYTVQEDQVPNGDFEDDDDSDDEPDYWSGQSTGAGTASYSDDGTGRSKGASMIGNGGNVLIHGSPTWTSVPIAVTPGRLMDLQLRVNVDGASSSGSVSLVYLGPLGEVLDVVTLLTIPLETLGFIQLERAFTLPDGVAKVQIVLTGFAPTDLATAGTVTFDEVGMFER